VSRNPAPAGLSRGGRCAAVYLQHWYDPDQESAAHDHQPDPVLRPVLCCPPLSAWHDRYHEPDDGCLLALVGGAPVGGRRLGTHPGRTPVVFVDQADGG